MGCCVSRTADNGEQTAQTNVSAIGQVYATNYIPQSTRDSLSNARGAGFSANNSVGDIRTASTARLAPDTGDGTGEGGVSTAAAIPSGSGRSRHRGGRGDNWSLDSPPSPKDVNPPSRNYVAAAPTGADGPSSIAHSSVQMPLTRRYLESEREAFFDTQVGGDVNAWSALRSACDVIRSGGESNLATATAILRASGLSCPSGRLWVEGKDIADQEARRAGLLPRRTRTQLRGGVWDERGNHYFVPAWVVTDPLGVVEGQGGSRMSAALVAVAGNGHAHDGHNSDAKGKAKAPEEPEVPEEHIVRVPVRVATAARDITCRIRRDDNVEVLVRRIRHKCQLEGDAKIRVVLMGKVLLNNLSLPSQGWSEGLVVQAFV